MTPFGRVRNKLFPSAFKRVTFHHHQKLPRTFQSNPIIPSATNILIKSADSNFDISMSEPAPKSQMLRVPTVLIPIVRELARLHREGHTTALLQRLQNVIAELDSKNDINFLPTNTNTKHLEEKLDQLESQLKSDHQALLQKLEKIERAIRTTRIRHNSYRRSNSYNPFQPPTAELGPFPHENLAQRLGLTPATLLAEREKLSTKEFISYTRNRDPRSFGWEWNDKDGLYHPVPQ